MNWTPIAAGPPTTAKPVIVWSRSGVWYEAVWSHSDVIFYQVNTGAPIPNVTHYCEITAPVD